MRDKTRVFWRWLVTSFFVACIVVVVIGVFLEVGRVKREDAVRIAEAKRMSKYQNFRYAWKGEVWIIDADDVSVREHPLDSVLSKLVCVIPSGSRVEILSMKGGGWKYVNVLSGNCTGWINGRVIREAYKEVI